MLRVDFEVLVQFRVMWMCQHALLQTFIPLSPLRIIAVFVSHFSLGITSEIRS